MEIPEFPIAVDLTMTELSELGLTLISSVTFKENSTIQLVSPTFNGILGEEFRFPCVIKSITEHKKTHQFEIKCSFVGLHDNNRQKIRNQTMKGHEISDKIDPGSQAS